MEKQVKVKDAEDYAAVCVSPQFDETKEKWYQIPMNGVSWFYWKGHVCHHDSKKNDE